MAPRLGWHGTTEVLPWHNGGAAMAPCLGWHGTTEVLPWHNGGVAMSRRRSTSGIVGAARPGIAESCKPHQRAACSHRRSCISSLTELHAPTHGAANLHRRSFNSPSSELHRLRAEAAIPSHWSCKPLSLELQILRAKAAKGAAMCSHGEAMMLPVRMVGAPRTVDGEDGWCS
jgi:hypothetical protein